MAKSETLVVVSDAGPLIHLDELEVLDLLSDFGTVLVPSIVWAEACSHRPALPARSFPYLVIVDDAGEPSPQLLTLANALQLHLGERAALALMEARGGTLLLCDDAAARAASDGMGFASYGTIGVLVRALRTGQAKKADVLAMLHALPKKSTLHISKSLLLRVMEDIECEIT